MRTGFLEDSQWSNARDLMILRNHGLIAASNSIAEAIRDIMFLEKACQIQIGALTPAPGHSDPPEIEQVVRLGWQAALRPL